MAIIKGNVRRMATGVYFVEIKKTTKCLKIMKALHFVECLLYIGYLKG